MKLRIGMVLCVLVFVLAFTQNAYCNIISLGTFDHVASGGINNVYDSPSLKLCWTPFPSDPSLWSQMLEIEMVFGFFTSEDIGRTVSVSSQTTEFNTYSSMLTNGFDDDLCVWTLLAQFELPGPGVGSQILDSNWVKTNLVAFQRDDFYGYEITRIDLTINDLEISEQTSYNPDIFRMETRTHFSCDMTYTIYGVPEPATLLLFGLGGLFLRKHRN